MMACFLARDLGMKEVLVPPTPGVLSALGGLIADLKNDFLTTLYLDLDADAAAEIRAAFRTLEARALAWLREDQGYDGAYAFSYSAELRYRGQSFEIETRLNEAVVAAADPVAIADAFHAAHERLYGHADRSAKLQAIAIRLVISGATAKPQMSRHELQQGAAEPVGQAEVWLDGAMRQAALFSRAALLPGQSFAGPAVVMQDDCTTVVPTGFTASVDAYTNLRIVRESAP
jgi:N-methylhydantoinase A